MTDSIIFRSYGACSIMLGPLGYKHFVPTGLWRLPQAVLLSRPNSNTLTELLQLRASISTRTLLSEIMKWKYDKKNVRKTSERN